MIGSTTPPSTPLVSGLQCIRCGLSAAMADDLYVCSTCGGNLLVQYQMDRIRDSWSREDLSRNTDRSMWRYAPLLPVRGRVENLQIGWSPLVPAPRLASALGLSQAVLFKDDGRNPSASFKDRASAVALVRARELGHKLVTGASTGNAASATAVLAAAMGMETRIFVPRSAPRAKIAQLMTFGANVLAVEGTYDQAFELCLEATRRFGWYNRNTGYNPYTREGKKTAAFEICEQLNWQVPDLVVVPVGDGNILTGIWKGFSEFHQMGFIDKTPKLLAVQAQGSAAITKALEGDGVIREVSGCTVADSISVSLPRDGYAAVKAVQESGGWGITVPDDAILEAIGLVARGAGIFCEPAAAAAYAGLCAAVSRGQVHKDWQVVVMATGNGLKDVAAAMKGVAEPRVIAADFSALENI